jgi:hypothetical protein
VVPWTDNALTTSVTKSGLTLTQGQTYYFSVKAVDGAGLTSICNSDGIFADINTTIDESENDLNISVQPNPFNENATLVFTIQTEQKIRITLTDMLGKEILLSNSIFSTGNHSIELNSDILQLSKGMYTLKISTEENSATLRLIKY